MISRLLRFSTLIACVVLTLVSAIALTWSGAFWLPLVIFGALAALGQQQHLPPVAGFIPGRQLEQLAVGGQRGGVASGILLPLTKGRKADERQLLQPFALAHNP